jgi:hypothetical protein
VAEFVAIAPFILTCFAGFRPLRVRSPLRVVAEFIVRAPAPGAAASRNDGEMCLLDSISRGRRRRGPAGPSVLSLIVVVAALVVVASPRRAMAARIPVIYQTGQDSFPCGPLPEPYDKEPELSGFQAGYVCDITGVFFTYFSVRDCKPAAIQGNSFKEGPDLAAAIRTKYPESTMQRGIWNHYGWMLMAALLVLGAFLWIKDALAGKAD